MTDKAMKIDQLLERMDRPVTEYRSFFYRQLPNLEFELYGTCGEGYMYRMPLGFVSSRFWADVAVATLTSYRNDMEKLLS